MAIQKINLGTEPLGEGGDTYRSANTKINENFSNTAHAASRLVGTANGQIPLAEQIGQLPSGAIIDSTSSKTAQENYRKGLVYNSGIGSAIGITGIGGTPVSTLSYSPSITNTEADQIFAAGRLVLFNDRLYMQGVEYLAGGYQYKPALTMYYSTANTTKDSNGFLKAASPIVKVFADKIELNGEAADQDVTYKKNGIGDYTITTVSGLSTDGWYIELPKDLNGNPKVAVTLSEEDGVISLKSYKRIFSMETFTFEPDLDNPLDIPDTRWIDLRLNEIPKEGLYEPEPIVEPEVVEKPTEESE